MKNLITYLFISALINISLCYSQSGWLTQYSGTNYHLCEIYFVNLNTGFTAGGGETGSVILKTTNGGINWFTNYQSSNPAFISIKFINSNTGWAVGGRYPISVIMKTTNQGVNWISQNNTTTGTIFSVYAVDSDTAYCAANYGIILKTTNGGTNWLSLQTPILNHLEYVQFINASTGFAVARGGEIIKTTNCGNNWFLSYNCSVWLISEKFLNQSTGYVSGRSGIILFTSDGGTNWSIQNSGTNNYLNEVLFTNSNTGYIVGDTGKVLRTTDSGVHWISKSSGIDKNLISIFFLNENTGYICGQFGTILKTTTGGNSFTTPSLIYPPNNSSNISLTPALTWVSDPPALYYKIQVSTLSNFSTIVDSATLTTTQRIIPAGKLSTGTTYFWRVNATNEFGTGLWSEVWNFGTVLVGIRLLNSEIPENYCLFNNFPNPFNPITNIKFGLPKDGLVNLKVYNMLGKEVATLVSEDRKAGIHEVQFNAENLSSGVYFYKLTVNGFTEVKTLTLIK